MSGKVYGDTATGGAAVGGAIGMLGGPEAAAGIVNNSTTLGQLANQRFQSAIVARSPTPCL